MDFTCARRAAAQQLVAHEKYFFLFCRNSLKKIDSIPIISFL
jgi:hypothetical protein